MHVNAESSVNRFTLSIVTIIIIMNLQHTSVVISGYKFTKSHRVYWRVFTIQYLTHYIILYCTILLQYV